MSARDRADNLRRDIAEIATRINEMRPDAQSEMIVYLIEDMERLDNSYSMEIARELRGYLDDRLRRSSGFYLANQVD